MVAGYTAGNQAASFGSSIFERKTKPAIWIAVACLETGRAKRRHFYVTKYGEREARRLAKLARAEMVKQILG
jgi:hypothetical protein